MQALSDSMTRRGRFAMQKVEGSSPFIRSKIPVKREVSLLVLTTKMIILSQNLADIGLPPAHRGTSSDGAWWAGG
jgi:hypothetical protein